MKTLPTAATMAALLGVAACVSAPETKLASARYQAALAAAAANLEIFEAAWIAEIDRLLRDLGDALEARLVNERIRMVSAEHGGFTNASPAPGIPGGGLVRLAAAIDGERDRVHAVLDTFAAMAISASDDPETAVEEIIEEYRRQALAAIDATPGLPAAERQRLLAEAESGPFGADPVANGILRVIVTWQAAKAAIPGDIDNLEAVLNALGQAHASVDLWIRTDVTVPGGDVAMLIEAWSAAIGEPE